MRRRKAAAWILWAPVAAVACASEPADTPTGDAPQSRAVATISEPNRFAPGAILDLPAEPVCESCRIEFGVPFELISGEVDGAMPGGLGSLERLGDGRFAAAFWGAAPIYLFGADGMFETTLGREGSGPGEFRDIGNGLFANGSALFVFDLRNGRLSVIDADGGGVLDDAQLHANVLHATFPSEDSVVIAGRQGVSDQPGYPLHVLDRGGSWRLSFGSAEPSEEQGEDWALERYLASAGDGTFWAAPMRELLVEQWTIEGERLRAYAGRRDRFAPGEYGNFTEAGRPTSRMYGISIDGDGLLWVLYAVASADWESNAEVLSPEEARARRLPQTRALPGRRIRDFFLEVIDVDQGAVLARELLPEAYFDFVGPRMLVRAFDDPETGNSRLEVVEAICRSSRTRS